MRRLRGSAPAKAAARCQHVFEPGTACTGPASCAPDTFPPGLAAPPRPYADAHAAAAHRRDSAAARPGGRRCGVLGGEGAGGAVPLHVQAAGGAAPLAHRARPGWREGHAVAVFACWRPCRRQRTRTWQSAREMAAPSWSSTAPVSAIETRTTTDPGAAPRPLPHAPQARELIVQNLPVSDDVMMRMLEALVQVGATAKQRRQLVRGAAGAAHPPAGHAFLPAGCVPTQAPRTPWAAD